VSTPSPVLSEPVRIVTGWRRFSMGLWRVSEGDIAAAYSADKLPKVGVFVHNGRWFTNCGCCYSKGFKTEANCYPLIPANQYCGADSVPCSYEGREVTHKGKSFRLGAMVVFVSSEPTIEECRRLLRTMFADGGYFASGCEYPEFLADRCHPDSENAHAATAQELADCESGALPRTKDAMREWLKVEAAPSTNPTQQLALSL
jgi:hypothetical protein